MSAKKKKNTKKSKKSKKTKDPKDIQLHPEVEAFAKWFADWRLRRGLRSVEAAEAADPDYWKKEKRARRKEKRLPTRWNEDHTMLILDDSDSED
jgi:hypothetical protein